MEYVKHIQYISLKGKSIHSSSKIFPKMKHIFTIIIVFLGLNLCAQTPQAIKYQAVARDGAGNVLANKAVSFRISILQTSASGSVKYSETHSKTTNTFGLVDLKIGHGTLISGSFAGINWGSDIHFVKVEMDPNGGTSYQLMGTSQLLSVPYALYAKEVQNKDDADADPANELQKISISGTVLTLDKSGGSVTLPSSGGDDNWGTQTVIIDATLSGNGTTSTPLKIADNGVNSSKITDGSIATADIANSAITSDKINAGAVTGAKIAQANATTGQALKWNGTTWAPAADETGTSNPTGPAGGDLTGTYPNPTIGEGKVTSAKILDGAIATADLADNTVTSAKIADATIVNADIANNAISSAKILDGTIATGDLAVSAVTTDKISTSAVTSDKLSSSAVTADKITTGAVIGTKIAQAGATTGQALKWNGTTWAPANDETGSGGTTPTGPAGGDLTGSYPDPTIATGKVTSEKILDGTIATADLADNAVTSAKIVDATISSADLTNNAVTTDKINSGAVTGAKIAQSSATSGQALKWNGTTWAPANDETGSGGTTPTGPAGGDLTGSYPDPTIATGKVTSAKILDGTIASFDLADNAVTSAKIADATIVNADMASNAISSAKILDGTIATGDLADNAVISAKIVDATIASADLANNAVTTDKINSGAVTGAKIAQASATTGQALKWNGTTWAPANDETGSGGTTPTGPAGGDLTGSYPDPTIAIGKVTSAKILDGTIASSDLADNAVTSEKIADATIVNADMASNAISSAKILDGTIATVDLAVSAVTTDKLSTSAVTTDKITAGAVTGTKIAQAGAASGQALKWDGTTWAPANDETGSGGTTPTGPAGGDLIGSYPDPTIATGKVTSAKILDATIATADLADNAVTSVKITDGAIATADLADNTVTSAKIADATIVNADMASNAISSAKILDGTIASADLATSAVTTDKISTSAVTTDKITIGAVTGTKIAQAGATSGQALKWDGTTWAPANDETGSEYTTPTGPAGGDLTGSYPDPTIATGKVTSIKILDGTIATTDLADNAVTSAKITDGAVAPADLADNAVTSAKIADATIASADMANNAVSSAKILDGTIATADLADNAVTSAKIADGAVASVDLAASAVTTDKILAGAVTGSRLAQGGATTGQVIKWNGSTWAPANDETGSSGTTPTGPAGGDLTGSYPDPLVGDGKITSAKILDGAIATADLAIDAVTSAKIADGAVASIDLADNAVTSVKIADGAVASADLAASSVTTDKLSAIAVTADKISTGAVTGTKIAQAGATLGQTLKWFGTTWAPANDETGSSGTTPTGPAGGDLTGSYPDPTIATGKVTSAKILDGTIATADLADNSVTSVKITDGAIATADLADNAVTSVKIADSTIESGDLVSNSVTTEKIADNAVTVAKLPTGATSDKFLRGDGTWAIPSEGSGTETDPTWQGEANETADIGRTGKVGIGTVTPTALLHTRGTGTGGGNILFEGEYKTYFPGAPPVEGAGTRMMWYPDQAVFRMGAVSDDRWDAANLGTFSTAIGYNCVASGSVSFSLGSYTRASNTCSVAIGHGAFSTAYAATALGYSTLASGYATTAMGDNTIAQAYVSTAIGQYNVGSGTGNSWEETEPIFEIGIGRTHTARKNAMTVLKNGYVGIGTPTPDAGLHIYDEGWPGSFVYLEADAGNDAGLRLNESTTPKWHIFNDASVGGLMIQNNATTPAIYCNQSNAYVGIRTSSPTQALHVVGDAYKTSGGTAWAISSDLRLKNLLGNYTKGLNEIATLQPVRFVYKENNPRQLTAGIEQVGFVAQEVQKIFPETVTEAADGYLDFNIHAINVALVNAVKELKIENDLLKTRLEKLELLLPVGSPK
jgi:hypothetical protein